jgi:hypothetical protein
LYSLMLKKFRPALINKFGNGKGVIISKLYLLKSDKFAGLEFSA